MANLTADRHDFRLYINLSELMRARLAGMDGPLPTVSTSVPGC